MVKGIFRAGKRVLRAQMVMMGPPIAIATIMIPTRMALIILVSQDPERYSRGDDADDGYKEDVFNHVYEYIGTL